MRPTYYDRNLHPISLEEWGQKNEDLDYKVVKQEVIGRYTISTVWMGLDHNLFRGPPLIFETMIFVDDDEDELYLYQDRYTTEAQALLGHEEAVNKCFDILMIERDSKQEERADLQKVGSETDLPQEVLDLLE